MEAEKDKQVSDNGTSFPAMSDYQKLNAITPDTRAKRILNEATTLLVEDPARFLDVLEDLKKKADSLTGKNHPLASVLGRRRDDPMMDVMMRNVREARKRDK